MRSWQRLSVCVLMSVLARATWAAPPIPVEEVANTIVPVPSVPAEVAKVAIEPEPTRREAPRALSSSEVADSRATLSIENGVTELVPIARNYMNHFITPFDDPKVLSVNQIDFHKEGRSIYLATSSDKPVGVEIRSNDPDDVRSISLALVPKAIPPRTVTLQWAGQREGDAPFAASNSKARRWEESAPYEDKLLELAQMTARGEIPEGYALDEKVEQVACELSNVQFFTGQRITGSHFTVYVLKATNTGRSTLELVNNAGCDFPGVVLVAPYPQAHLEPGQSTEVYVVKNNDALTTGPRDNIRHSLLN